MTIQEICRNVEDLLRNDKGRTNFSPAARYAVRMLLDYAERASALEASRCGGIRMDAVKFVEERRRMFAGSAVEYSLFDMNTRAEDVVKEVEEWSAAHPRKTRQSVFLEQYPEAQIDDNDVLSVCPAVISLSHRKDGGGGLNIHKVCANCHCGARMAGDSDGK